ncbi:MAG: hypothetical protein LBH22_04835 [Bacteroidales bacterium]|jgi:hypothetical protein|nr:hypothetical protein [Bacteroidales bacterium]
MKKILVFCMLASIIFMSCKKDSNDSKPIDLSKNGTANCYLITSSGTYSFNAKIIGNGTSGIISSDFHTSNPTISPVSVKLVWQDYYYNGKGLITELTLNEDKTKVIFTISEAFGNAVIAVCDVNENILWSWHIWKPASTVKHLSSSTGYDIMNMNVGATLDISLSGAIINDTKSYGMLYQWGRKDPLPASATLTGTTTTVSAPMYDMEGNPVTIQNSSWTDVSNNTLLYAIQNPTICFSRWGQLATSGDWLTATNSVDALWGNPKGYERDENLTYINKGKKSIYDPCPVGWRVPPSDVFRNFVAEDAVLGTISFDISEFQVQDLNGDGEITIDDYSYGWFFKLNENVYSYFPSASRFDGQYGMLMGSMSGIWGTYWSNSPDGSADNPGRAYSPLSFGTSPIMVTTLANAGRADAYSIRCIKE